MLPRLLPALLLAVLSCVFALAPARAEAPLAVAPDRHGGPVGTAMSVLEDGNALLDIEAVASPMYATRFRPVTAERPNFGFSRSAFWFRLQVDLRGAPDRTWYLVERHPLLDELTFFLPDDAGGWRAVRMGDTLPFATRSYALRDFVLPLPHATEAPLPVYVRVAGQGALTVDLELVDAQGLAESESRKMWGFGLFYGALLVMFLYNLVLYWSTRERSQFYYIVFLGGFTLLFFSLDGFGLQFLWPGVPTLNGWFPVFTCLAVWGGLQFTRNFLEIARDDPRMDRGFRAMTHAVWIIFLLGLLLPRHWAYLLGTVLPLFFAVLMLAGGIARLRQGYRPARLFVAGWGVMLAGAVLLPLANLGILPVNALTAYSTQFGAVLQVILLSLAIGERMKLLKAENERIQREAHERLEQTFAELAARDADKTRFIHYLSHELNTPLNWMSSTRGLDAGRLPGEVRETLAAVEAGQQRMMDLVSVVMRYFDLAGEDRERVARTEVAPMWIVDDILREYAPAIAEKQLAVVNRVPADLVVLAGEQRLHRILSVLVDNAIHFSRDGGEVRIDGGTETYGTRGAIRVHDQGRGIEPERLARIFEPFFNVGSQHREDGFGLSLATARLMAEGLGGDIRVESAGRDQGATFSVILPTAASASARPATAQNPGG